MLIMGYILNPGYKYGKNTRFVYHHIFFCIYVFFPFDCTYVVPQDENDVLFTLQIVMTEGIIFQVWDLATLQCIQTLSDHTGVVMSVLCWDQFLLSCSLDQTIKVSLCP